jgi:hypothetical protein
MQKLWSPLLVGIVALPVAAQAAPKICSDPLRDWEAATAKVIAANAKLPANQQMPLPQVVLDGSNVDCMKDGVLVVNGDTMANGFDDAMGFPPGPVVTCMPAKADPTIQSCTVDYRKAIKRALDLMGAGDDRRWDQIVIFAQQMSRSPDPDGPLFFRAGFRQVESTELAPGVNEVDHIGFAMPAAVTKRIAGQPFVGWVGAGGTDQAAKFVDIGGDGPLKSFQKEDPTGPLATYGSCNDPADNPATGNNPALCYRGFYNFFDALAQATGSMFGPYLKGPNDGDPLKDSNNKLTEVTVAPLSAPPLSKAALGKGDPLSHSWSNAGGAYQSMKPRIWNSFVDMGGSLLGGSAFRDNGDGTFETSLPTAYYGVNVPFESGWKPGAVLAGTSMLRFQPLDLYLLGLMPVSDLPLTLRAFITQLPTAVAKPALDPAAFGASVGPMMGLRTGVAIRPIKHDKSTVEDEILVSVDQIVAQNGGERVPAFKDAPHYIKQLWIVVTKPQALIEKDAKDDTDKLVKQTTALRHIDAVANWRHQFAAYYYMMTGYRGRVVTTPDGVDDNAYWEFGQPMDDAAAFAPDEGVRVGFPGHEQPNRTSPDIQTVMRINASPGGQAGIKFTGKPLGLRVVGDPTASRVPPNAVVIRMKVPSQVKSGSFATVVFDGGPSIRVPAMPAALVPDGKWHTYSAALNSDDFKKGSFGGFTFIPSNQPFDAGDGGIEVDFIRMNNVPSAGDSDVGCDGKAKPDGWVDSEDNCPNVYNPLQEDGNNDGIGDACEDFDGDGVVNACDNCPAISNSRQRDQNGNGIGDVCDSTQSSSCFLNPGSMAGPVGAAPGAGLAILIAGVVGGLLRRRRRSR